MAPLPAPLPRTARPGPPFGAGGLRCKPGGRYGPAGGLPRATRSGRRSRLVGPGPLAACGLPGEAGAGLRVQARGRRRQGQCRPVRRAGLVDPHCMLSCLCCKLLCIRHSSAAIGGRRRWWHAGRVGVGGGCMRGDAERAVCTAPAWGHGRGASPWAWEGLGVLLALRQGLQWWTGRWRESKAPRPLLPALGAPPGEGHAQRGCRHAAAAAANLGASLCAPTAKPRTPVPRAQTALHVGVGPCMWGPGAAASPGLGCRLGGASMRGLGDAFQQRRERS